MTRPIDLRVLELLAARLCHDLIGPVAAIANGVELLGEDDPEFVRDAVALVGDSAGKANRRLQFYRFAYGFSGGGLTGPAPHQLAAEFFSDGNVACEYPPSARDLPLQRQKLVCAMLAVAGEGLPRGGKLSLELSADGLAVEAAGEGTGPTPDARAALALAAAPAELTTRTVAAYFAGLLAEAQGLRLSVTERQGGFRLGASPG